MVAVFWIVGNVMEILTVKTVLMKIQVYVINENAILQHSLLVKMAVVFLNSGCVTLTMIAAMTLTNLLTCVDKRTVLQDGKDVQDGTITGKIR